MDPIVVSALALVRDRKMLMVVARDRDVLYLPGGKVEPGESGAAAAIREAREEVSVELDPASVRELFTVRTQAHGEPEGRLVEMTLFAGDTDDEPHPAAEVGSIAWVTTADAHRCPPAGVATLEQMSSLGLID
ncbi:NUDIX hydrolase [Frondihabitans australicus]|uniref:ADP-ribose pyrophosphatase YjhB (NUDIX family) n=1 Tax=Frondihabitans australicus TaxID=386892 RepID=A0A495IIC4_9MICO|nr:NUDIX domain-containing protein [Frondihabitans australicus]RKR75743.1 ADP-ribose pyrophosphatase YjhB (NUDIX family) [Frondihabitans australicus]